MEFWQIYLLINLVAAVFIVWPTIFVAKKHKKELRASARTETNAEVYSDHFRELEQTLSRGEIDEEDLSGLKRDLEKTMVEENNMVLDGSERPIISSFKSRIPVLVLVFALPIFSLMLYGVLGAKEDWEIYQLAKERKQAPQEQLKDMTGDLIASLQDRLKQKPENSQNWYLLAASAMDNGQFDEGVRAYRELLELEPEAPMVKAELAQALFMRAGNAVTPEVRKHTKEALEISPNLPTALGLAGIDAFQVGNYQGAIDFWQKALVQLDPRSSAAQALTGGIARAKVAIKQSGGETENNKTATPAKISVAVSLGKDVDAQPSDTVFVYARAWQGPKMPLAIQKIKVSDLPKTIELDQSMAMTQGMDLSRFPQVEVVARISSSGSAISQAGDWQATQGPIIVNSQKGSISLEIVKKIPEDTKTNSEAPEEPKVVDTKSLTVNVAIGSEVEAKPSDTVFVYARAWQGPKMPLAIQKVKVSDLPKQIELDQSMAMTQGMDLSRFPRVEVVARISSSGSAISQTGDWQASQGPVEVASQKDPIILKIVEKIP